MIQSLCDQCRQHLMRTAGCRISADEPPETCPICGGHRWLVQKTRPRQGRTLTHGQFEARETVRICAAGCRHPARTLVTQGSDSLTKHLLPGSNFGYDVMVFVGLERFLHQRQREEIQMALLDQGIRISTGEVSKLSDRFVNALARLHRARADKLRAVLEADGGWPLHIDVMFC